MIKASNIYRWLWGSLMLMGLLLQAACSDDSSDEPQGGNLRLLSVTRAGDDHDHITDGGIKMFVCTKKDEQLSGDFDWNSGWENKSVSVKENTQYYFYGYMPNDDDYTGSVKKPDGSDFSGGADLKIEGLPIFTSKDVLVVVGVQKIEAEQTSEHALTSEGNYGYLSGIASQNYVNLLMGHLYSQLQLRFCVDKTYYALRCIHLKEVKLKSTYVANGDKVTATLSLRNGKGLTGQVAYSDPVATIPETPAEWPLLTGGNVELVVEPEANAANPEYTVLSNTVNCAPCLFAANGAYLSVETKYDVYDRDNSKGHGNLIRANCKATNKIQVSGMAPGVRKMLTLTVAPTYLYVLSDPDLDNPTIYIGN